MTRRLRFVGVVLHPQFMVDDGEHLVPLQVQPLTVAAADWPDVVARFAAAMEALRGEIEEPPGEPAPGAAPGEPPPGG